MDYESGVINTDALGDNLATLMNVIETENIAASCWHDMYREFLENGVTPEKVDTLLEAFYTDVADDPEVKQTVVGEATDDNVKLLHCAWQASRVLEAFFNAAHKELHEEWLQS